MQVTDDLLPQKPPSMMKVEAVLAFDSLLIATSL
jgi:hypothetical protein